MPQVNDPGGSCCPAGRKLSAVQIAEIALLTKPTDAQGNAIPGGNTAAIATAIALAESGGDEGACGSYVDASGKQHYVRGLWQMSDIHGFGQDSCSAYYAAKEMWRLSANGTDWSAWSTYKGVSYYGYLPLAKTAQVTATTRILSGNVPGGRGAIAAKKRASDVTKEGLKAGMGNLGGGGCDGLVPVAKQLCQIFTWFTSAETWIRLGETVGGAVLVLVAIWLLFSHTQAGQGVKNVATKGLP